MGSPASSRLLEGYKLDETKQLLWHKRVLEVTKKLELWNVRMEGAVESVLPGCARTYESENHSRYTVVSLDIAAFCLDSGALPIRSKNETDSV